MNTDTILKNFGSGDIHNAFWAIVELATLREGKVKNDKEFATESSPARYGNVEFWRDINGSWCYSVPTNRWNHKDVAADLSYWF